MRSLFPLAAALLPLAGCISVTSFSQVRERIPAEDMLEIDGQTVHIEQSGAGVPVILLHGFGESTTPTGTSCRRWPTTIAWSRSISTASATERPRSAAAYTLDGQQRLVLGVLDRLGIESAHFVGHSTAAD